MKKKLFISIIISTLLSIGIMWTIMNGSMPLSPRKSNGIELLNFSKGDAFSGHLIYDAKNNAHQVQDLASGIKILIFAWDLCGDCQNELSTYADLISLYDKHGVDIFFIWDDSIPFDELNKLSIPNDKHYSAKGKYKFTDQVPMYFVVDENDEIIHIIDNTKELCQYIENICTVNNNSLLNWIGSNLIFFTLDGCKSCDTAYNALLVSGVYLEQEIYIVCETSKSAYNVDKEDKYHIYASALGITMFPAFCIIDRNGSVLIAHKLDDIVT